MSSNDLPLCFDEIEIEDPTERIPRALLWAALDSLIDDPFEFATTRCDPPQA